jgi:hypothetical protein
LAALDFGCRWRHHLGIKLKQLFQPLGIVLETAADVDALQHFVVALVGAAQIFWQVAQVAQVGDSGGEMGFARKQDGLDAGDQIGSWLLSRPIFFQCTHLCVAVEHEL